MVTMCAMTMGVFLCLSVVLFFMACGLLWTQIVLGYMLKARAEKEGLLVGTPPILGDKTGPRPEISREGSDVTPEGVQLSEAEEWQALFNI